MRNLILSLILIATVSAASPRLAFYRAFSSAVETSTDLIPRDGLVAWYRGAGDALDSALSNDGTWALGTERYTTGKIGQAFDFDGASFIDCGTNSSINLTNDFTVAMWAKTTDTNTTVKGLAAKVANNDEGWQVVRINNMVRFPVYTAVDRQAAISNADLPSNTWTHIVAKYTKSTSLSEIYIDSVLQTVTGLRSVTPQPTLRLVIGSAYSVAGSFRFTGSIDETLIYNRALTDDEIAILANPANYPPE